jgi:hypothetical protein
MDKRNKRPFLTELGELAIILGSFYFIYSSHGWELATGIGGIGILLIRIGDMCRTIIHQNSILIDKVYGV